MKLKITLVFLVSAISLKIKIYAKLTEEQEIVTNLVQSYFDNFSLYLTSEYSNSFPKINADSTFLSYGDELKNSNSNDLMEEYKKDNSSDLSLIGFFKQLLDNTNSNTLKTSSIQEKIYLFVNYDPKEILQSNKKIIPLIMINEFLNYLFYFNEKKLEIHNGPCIRNINESPDLSPSELIFSNKYSLEELKFCENCSERIIGSVVKFDLGTSKLLKNTSSQALNIEKSVETESTKEETLPTNLVQRATRPPPRRTKELSDPNAELSFAQRKQINNILKELSLLKEPLDDPEYLEVRNRFFEGKISEQVFLQILKRKSK